MSNIDTTGTSISEKGPGKDVGLLFAQDIQPASGAADPVLHCNHLSVLCSSITVCLRWATKLRQTGKSALVAQRLYTTAVNSVSATALIGTF